MDQLKADLDNVNRLNKRSKDLRKKKRKSKKDARKLNRGR